MRQPSPNGTAERTFSGTSRVACEARLSADPPHQSDETPTPTMPRKARRPIGRPSSAPPGYASPDTHSSMTPRGAGPEDSADRHGCGEEPPDRLGGVGPLRIGVRAARGPAGPGMAHAVDDQTLVDGGAAVVHPARARVGVAARHAAAYALRRAVGLERRAVRIRQAVGVHQLAEDLAGV